MNSVHVHVRGLLRRMTFKWGGMCAPNDLKKKKKKKKLMLFSVLVGQM